MFGEKDFSIHNRIFFGEVNFVVCYCLRYICVAFYVRVVCEEVE